ncbi:MEDS domain-containing protein [Vulgatibacter sp.]|uniref:MEDS domain-containing protein n=1 Tax=Vulgatibacter sp. TaxID=1971226 RepID=UPI00356A4989
MIQPDQLRPDETSWQELPSPPAHAHGVRFYEEDEALCFAIADYLGAGLAAGETAIAVVTADHAARVRALLAEAGFDPDARRLAILDANALLDRLLVDGMPDPGRFEQEVASVVAAVAAGGAPRVRAFGEMVDLLWRDGNLPAAIRLEELWNDLSHRHEFALLCAYVVDRFLKDTHGESIRAICALHTHVFPGEQGAGPPPVRHAGELAAEIEHRKRLAAALRTAVSDLRRSVTEQGQARRALEDAHAALEAALGERDALIEQLQANARFSELFVGILGHDLRNPLMAIGTAASLLERRSECEKLAKPIGRIQSSAGRMSRMIDQILDFTRVRLGAGFPLASRPIDLADLFRSVLDELQATDGAAPIVFEVAGDTTGRWDADRLAQLVSNLAGNALLHRSLGSTVRIGIDGAAPGSVVARFDNEGRIPAEILPVIFEPFREANERRTAQSSGLGLGLFISRQIVLAHGGSIAVESSEASGTSVVVELPRDAAAVASGGPTATPGAPCS